MLEYIKGFKTEFDDRLNKGIMNHEFDRPLVEHILDAWKSLEIVDSIKIIDWSYSEEEHELDVDKYQRKRKGTKKVTKGKMCKSIKDDKLGVFRVKVKLTVPHIDPQTGQHTIQEGIVKKVLMIPIVDEDGYIQLKGKKYYMIYQLVDKSTYDNKDSVVLKSLMPVKISRATVSVNESVDGLIYKLPIYKIKVFKKQVNALLYYAARPGGLQCALEYLMVHNVIHIVDDIGDNDKNIYFDISKSCFIEVNRKAFDNSLYVRACTGMIAEAVSNRFDASMIHDETIFIRKLTASGSLEKGRDSLTLFNRFLDIGTRKTLLTGEINKSDVHALIRWIMMNFNQLRAKDSNSFYNQRLRVNEYIASLLTMEFSNRLTKIIKLGSKATIDDLTDFFKFDSYLLIQKFHSSGILRFDESINDMSQFFCKFKYTTKGPHSIGGKGASGGSANSDIPIEKRSLHPSAIGFIDLNVCSTSDPGRSGVISPFTDMKSLYFSEALEPDDTMYDLVNRVNDILEENDNAVIKINADDKADFYRILYEMDKIAKLSNVWITSRDEIIVDNKGCTLDDDKIAEEGGK